MNKNNFFIKKLKTQFLSINNSIESNFNNLKNLKKNFKKTRLTKDNKVFLSIAAIIFLTLSYFIIPTLYNKNIIKGQIKNHILKKYNIDIKFNEKVRYGLLPKPHFATNNLSIIREKNEIANVKDFKIFISSNDFLNVNKIKIRDILFNKADFEIQIGDVDFFKNLMKTAPNENMIIIRNSNIFYKNNNGEVLFINKIYSSKFYYDSSKLRNILSSKNKVFNVPYKIKIENDKFNKKISTIFSAKKIRLVVQNEYDYDEENRKGILDILFVSKNTRLDYKFSNDKINFESGGKKNNYKGTIDIKPFFLTANLDYDGISSKNLFNDESLLIELIKSEIFNNKNLNANIKLNLKDIINIEELNNLLLNITFDEGEINFSDSSIMWKEHLKILLDESFLNYDGNQISLNGKITLDFLDLDNFYRSFQIKKNYRKKIQQIELYFVYDFNANNIGFSNAKIDNKPNLKVEEYFDKFNEKENRVLNKIKFKNLVNDFFRIYSG